MRTIRDIWFPIPKQTPQPQPTLQIQLPMPEREPVKVPDPPKEPRGVIEIQMWGG